MSDAARRPSARAILILFVVAFVIRLAAITALGISKEPTAGSDAEEYDTYAWNLAQGRGYRGMSPDVSDQDHLTAFRPPLPSIMWSIVYRVCGHRYEPIRVLGCLLGAGSVVFLFLLGARLFTERIALIAALWWAVFPTAIVYTSILGGEPLLCFLFGWMLYACVRFGDEPTWRRAIGTGAIFGLILLSHASKIFMLPMLVVWAVWQFRKQPAALVRSLAIPAVAALLLVPWTVRNYRVFHKIIPFSTMGGSVLLQGNNRMTATIPELIGYNVWDTEIPEYRDQLRAPDDEVGRDAVARKLAMDWLKQNWKREPYMIQAKIRRGFTPFLQPNSPLIYRLGTLLGWGPVLLLFLLSYFPTLFAFLRKGDPGWLIHLAVLDFVAMSAVFFGLARYRLSIEPVCILLAVVSLEWAYRRLRGR